jgi:septal ring factor EnvC (AmiA/AmiB activator)
MRMHQLKVLLPLLLVLAAPMPLLHAQARAARSGAQTPAVRAIDESASNLEQLNRIHASTVELHNKLSTLYTDLEKKVADLGKLATRSSTTREQLIEAARQLQETQLSFNRQYLQLQNQMQNENRQFTMVSDIMKTKHDTAKNAISNIR